MVRASAVFSSPFHSPFHRSSQFSSPVISDTLFLE